MGGAELEAHHVGHEQGDEPIALVGRVARRRAPVGARQAELFEGEVAGVVVAPVELVEHRVEEAGEGAVRGAAARNLAAQAVEIAEQPGVGEVLADRVDAATTAS